MKLFTALTLLSTTTSQEYARINKLRGADLSSKTIKLTHDAAHLSLNSVHLESGDDAAEMAACAAHAEKDCSGSCTWCVSGAVASGCYPTSMTGRLPAGVFACSSVKLEDGGVVEDAKEVAEESIEGFESAADEVMIPKSQFFNLKQGITLTLTSDAVDNDFCDPNSDVSLAGYMNGELRY